MNNTTQQTAIADHANNPKSKTVNQEGTASSSAAPTTALTKPKKTKAASGKGTEKKPKANSAPSASGQSAEAKSFRPGTKAEIILRKLKTARGATIEELSEVTGWQRHSVRGFLSGTVKKKLGLELMSEAGKDGIRRYRIADGKSGS